MSESKHTPGPWFVGAQNDGLYVIDRQPSPSPYDAPIPATYGPNVIATPNWRLPTYEANARLIAAAPDLLAGAIAAESETPGDDFERRNEHGVFVWMTWETIEALRAAISKAEGRS